MSGPFESVEDFEPRTHGSYFRLADDVPPPNPDLNRGCYLSLPQRVKKDQLGMDRPHRLRWTAFDSYNAFMYELNKLALFFC